MSSIESHLSNKPKQVFFNPINIFDTFTHSITLLYIFNILFSFNVNFLIYSYATAVSVTLEGREFATTNGTIVMGTGYGLADNLGKTVVIYSSTGLRIGCGVLASKASDSALSELGTLVQQGKYL